MCQVVLSWTVHWGLSVRNLLLRELIAVLNHFGLHKLAVALTIVRYLVHKYKFILNSSSYEVSRHFPKACLNAYSLEAPGRGCHGPDSFKFEPWEEQEPVYIIMYTA